MQEDKLRMETINNGAHSDTIRGRFCTFKMSSCKLMDYSAIKIVKIKIYVNIGNAFDDKSSIINRAENLHDLFCIMFAYKQVANHFKEAIFSSISQISAVHTFANEG